MNLYRCYLDTGRSFTFAASRHNALRTAAWFAKWRGGYLTGLQELRTLSITLELTP